MDKQLEKLILDTIKTYQGGVIVGGKAKKAKKAKKSRKGPRGPQKKTIAKMLLKKKKASSSRKEKLQKLKETDPNYKKATSYLSKRAKEMQQLLKTDWKALSKAQKTDKRKSYMRTSMINFHKLRKGESL
jgi:hypothetical protein